MNQKDLTGMCFGRLKAIQKTDERKNGSIVWKCVCECGNEAFIQAGSLTSGRTKSCGCIQKEKASSIAKTGSNRRKHGMEGTHIYFIWQAMKKRCGNPNCDNYSNYGARGITVCDEWKNSFESFYDYVSKLPHFGEEGYSLDRINNDGNYEPSNVKWSTKFEQTHNRRISKKVGKSNGIIT